MEPIGLAAGLTGLAGLFSVCLDVIDKVDSYKDFGFESRLIIAQFEADKLLFTQWAQTVGISEDNHRNNCSNFIINTEMIEVVRNILFSIQEIFSKTSSTMLNLQSVVDAGPKSLPDRVLFLRGIKDNKVAQSSEGALSKRSRIAWSLRSKEKLINQVQQFGALVEKLHRLVPLEGARGPANVRKGKLGHDINLGDEKAIWFSNSQRLLFEMEKQIEHERRKELGNWLAASWTDNDYCNLIQRKLDGTCGWILSRSEFSNWLSPDFPSSAAKILWINGPAGYGKTILCASVVHYLTTTLESPLAYYFCSSDSEIRRDSSSIMRSWISQVISFNRDAFEIACGKWEAKDGINASQIDIFELLKSIVQHVPNCTFIVDGLDECAWAEENWRSNGNSPVSFFESLKHAAAETKTRILILSRDEPEIRYGFRAVLSSDGHLDLAEYKICLDDVRSDTMLFSRSVVDKKLGNKSETLKHELAQQMVDRCEGMFLWVKMLEKDLRSWKNKKQLEETIKHAPTALAQLYDRSWMKILHFSDKDRLRAFSILRWAAFALRPLTILELTEALGIIDDDNCEELLVDDLPDTIDDDYISSEILGPCGSLLETQKMAATQDLGSMTIHLAHFSVKQYILCNMPSQGGILMRNEQICNSAEIFQCNILAKLCLRYLNFRGVWADTLELKSGPVIGLFRNYAAELWHHHLQESASNYSEVIKLANTLFSSENGNWESMKKWLDNNEEKSDTQEFRKQATSTSPLLYVSLFGPRETIKYLLKRGKVSVNDTNELKQTALQAAATEGRTLTVKLLLENSADMTIADNNGWT
ncbi:prion-inhibition and propagation-domain-containing protein, partial [Bisporella sp. PMI_857]